MLQTFWSTATLAAACLNKRKGTLLKKALLLAVYAVAAGWVHGQTVKDGAPIVLFTNQTVTSAYVAGDLYDLKSYDSFVLKTVVGTAAAATAANLKYQWSDDRTVWVDETVLYSGTTNSIEQPYIPLSRVVLVPLTSTSTNYIERVRRLARYFRPMVKDSASTNATSTISVQIIPMNNQN